MATKFGRKPNGHLLSQLHLHCKLVAKVCLSCVADYFCHAFHYNEIRGLVQEPAALYGIMNNVRAFF